GWYTATVDSRPAGPQPLRMANSALRPERAPVLRYLSNDVAFAPLDSTDVVSMQVRQLRQALLGKTSIRPQFPDALAKQYPWIRASNLQSWCSVNTMSSTHYECDIVNRSCRRNRAGRGRSYGFSNSSIFRVRTRV